MRFSNSQGHNIRTSTASPYDLSGGSDGQIWSLFRCVGVVNVGRLVSLATTGEAATTLPGQQVSVATASSGVSSTVHGAPRGIYEGNGGKGADNTTVTYAAATTTVLPGKQALTGNVIEVLQKGCAFACAYDYSTNGATAIVIGDILGVPTAASTGGDGNLAKIGTQGTTQVLARVTALEANTSTSTTGVGWATKVLVNFA